MSEESDQVVMFVWKRKWSPAVSAVSNAFSEIISNTQHRFALAVLYAVCAALWGWSWNTSPQSSSQEPLRVAAAPLSHKCLGDCARGGLDWILGKTFSLHFNSRTSLGQWFLYWATSPRDIQKTCKYDALGHSLVVGPVVLSLQLDLVILNVFFSLNDSII